jgi:acetyl-CoA carboxylase biotin carboxyl carrier protein
MPDLDSYLVRHALTLARENGYAEVELSSDGATFTAVLEPKAVRPKATKATPETPEPVAVFVKSSLVGYLQSLSIAEGDRVEKGAKAAVVAALGLANDVESTVTGEVVEILVKAGDPVEFGQPLAKVMPD